MQRQTLKPILGKLILLHVLWLFGSPAFSQHLITRNFSDDAIEMDDSPATIEAESAEQNALELDDDDEDLKLSQTQIREKFRYGFGIGAGAGMPWQEYHLEAVYIWRPDIWFTTFIGVGDSEFNGSTRSAKYAIDSDQNVFGVGARWFVWDVVPFYLSSELGLTLFDGSIAPRGPVTLGGSGKPAIVRSHYDAQGIVTAVGIGFHVSWESGWFIDYKLAGVMRSFITALNVRDSSTRSRDSIRNNFEKPYEFGIFNIKVGYMIP